MTMSHPVITDVGFRGDLAHASSVVKALAGAGQAIPPGRSIKRKLQLRYTTHAIRNRGIWGCRASAKVAKAVSAMKASLSAVAGTPGVRATAWGEGTGRANWGPSAAGGPFPQPGGIIHKPPGGRQRRRCGHSKRRANRTAQPVGEPRATGLAVQVRSLQCRLDTSPITDSTLRVEIRTVTAYKRAAGLRRWPWRQAGLKPYWGKPTVRNFRGGRGNEVDGLMTVCHDARKGRYIGSHWPNHVRASALLDVFSGSFDLPFADCALPVSAFWVFPFIRFCFGFGISDFGFSVRRSAVISAVSLAVRFGCGFAALCHSRFPSAWCACSAADLAPFQFSATFTSSPPSSATQSQTTSERPPP